MKPLVIIPAYNEAETILNTIRDLKDACPEMDYLVINDCSTDNTGELLQQRGIDHINLPINLGIGGGIQAGYRYALANGYDAAVQFDGDGQHRADYLHTLLEPLEADRADVVIGSRFLEKDGFQSSAIRRFGIRFLSGLIHGLCGVRVLDATSGMRAVNRKMIAFYAEHYAQDYPEPEALLAAGLRGARVLEIPVRMRERQGGQSSITPFVAAYYMIKVTLALLLTRVFGGRDAL